MPLNGDTITKRNTSSRLLLPLPEIRVVNPGVLLSGAVAEERSDTQTRGHGAWFVRAVLYLKSWTPKRADPLARGAHS